MIPSSVSPYQIPPVPLTPPSWYIDNVGPLRPPPHWIVWARGVSPTFLTVFHLKGCHIIPPPAPPWSGGTSTSGADIGTAVKLHIPPWFKDTCPYPRHHMPCLGQVISHTVLPPSWLLTVEAPWPWGRWFLSDGQPGSLGVCHGSWWMSPWSGYTHLLL